MKKLIYACALLVSAAVATSCQKEQDAVTLTAVIDKDSKVYIDDDRYPRWHADDQVYVNDQAYALSRVNGSYAEIADVSSAAPYCAIYPADIVAPGADISSGSQVAVTLNPLQVYERRNGRQKVNVPMGAYVSSGNTLNFHNLCSIVRVTVENSRPGDTLRVKKITLSTSATPISGMGSATVAGNGTTDKIAITNGSNTVSLAKANGTVMETLLPPTGNTPTQAVFDIVVPEFATPDNVDIEVETSIGQQSYTVSNAHLNHNSIVSITTTLDEHMSTFATLETGTAFVLHIPNQATAVRFECGNTSVNSGTALQTTGSAPIYGNLQGTTWVVSTPSEKMNAHPSCQSMFKNKSGLTSIEFCEGFCTDNVYNMSEMFSGCSGLTSLDLSVFNTENVKTMYAMFNGCSGLTTSNLAISGLNTSGVTNMATMFKNCSGLNTLDLSNFSTEQVRSMNSMFEGCRGLTSLNVSSFNTTNVTTMKSMFYGCSHLTQLDLASFNTGNVTDMSYMFYNCQALTAINISNFNTANVEYMNQMFYQCKELTAINFPSTFTTPRVVSMQTMFKGCEKITSLDLSTFSTGSVTNMESMFQECKKLTSLVIPNFVTGNVTTMKSMFRQCQALTTLTLPTTFTTQSVTDMSYMFYWCGVQSLDLSTFDTRNVVYMNNMFCNCRNITALNLSNTNFVVPSDKSNMFNNFAYNSHQCTITCSSNVETSILTGTSINTSWVTFVRPS